MYDISRRETFDHVAQWLSEAKKNSNPHMVIILVGNKADLEHKRVVRLASSSQCCRAVSPSLFHLSSTRMFSFAEGERFAKANDLLFLEASAKTGDYVEETMVTAAINVLERIKSGQFRMDDEVRVCNLPCFHRALCTRRDYRCIFFLCWTARRTVSGWA